MRGTGILGLRPARGGAVTLAIFGRAQMRSALQHPPRGARRRRSLRVALLVGTVLTLINQGDVIFSTGAVDWLKCLLTYVVPYIVSTYGAVAFRMGMVDKVGTQ